MIQNPSVQRWLLALSIVGGMALGVGGMVAGEADDSPGLQLIGLLFIIGAITLTVHASRRTRGRGRTRP